ncbi:MAG: DUF4363 family protein [Clostridia bacterium]|nr:DUF4363 family protein [Clostridia bacterium]
MAKDIIICIVIISLIVCFNIVTQKHTNNKIRETTENLEELREAILEEKANDDLMGKIQKINEQWENANKKMSYYIEHDELEKVKTELAELSANLEIEEYSQALPIVDRTIYILEHIKEKVSLNLKNIF